MIAIKIRLDDGALKPTKAHGNDVGYDVYAREDKLVPAGGSAVFDIGVHFDIPSGYAGMIKSKSGLNVKRGLISDGVVDPGYTGSIRVKLYNLSDEDYKVYKGDKVSQIVFVPCLCCALVEDDKGWQPTDRGDNGFGSSGR